MLFLKRLLTSFVLFVALWITFFLGTLAVVGGVVGARAAAGNPNARDYQSGYAAGHAAGEQMGRKYGLTILLVSCGVSAVASITISFTGVLPWCRRRPQQPPPVPNV
jgi:hypothetical protein